MPRELDEDDVRVRPARSTRPRTKSRPSHDDAVLGDVVTVDRGRYRVRVDGELVTAVRARELGRRAVVVGDRVAVVGDVSGRADTLARVVRYEP
ncbi:MAG: ribosome biosis GTPase / thiamine phosphate phosphatase, partial [Frankiales bacterium]|nr:ribosome biosis GTPase / thiamine phosphate phosphatase [Frankiales bacterium]